VSDPANAAAWQLVHDNFESAATHFAHAVDLYDRTKLAGDDSYVERMAFMHAMMAGHSSAETGLKRLLGMFGEKLPDDSNWHADMIRSAALAMPHRPAIVDAAVAAHLQETRRFRHVAVHVYDDFEPARAGPSIEAARALKTALGDALVAFRRRFPA